jgi:putative cell wall-binding protein
VLEEIQRLGADHVVLLGGRVALSDAVQQGLADAQVTTERRFGANRFETAYSIADGLLATPAETTTPTVFLVEGDNADPARGWPDAVSAAPYAAFLQAPILLTLQDAID